jgi:hypothetical protein
MDKVDGDRVVDISRDLYGVDPTAVNEDDKVKKTRQARQQAQMQQMKLEQAQAAASAAKDGASAHKSVKEAQKA